MNYLSPQPYHFSKDLCEPAIGGGCEIEFAAGS